MVIFDRRSDQVLRSKPFLFFFSSAILLGCVAFVFSWIAFSRFERPIASPTAKFGCRPDGEGSWAIGVFYGDSPFSLKPIEDWNVWRNESEAWPVANPVFTCALATNVGFPSNFVADPFLFAQESMSFQMIEAACRAALINAQKGSMNQSLRNH